jgi:hypothetical protein
MISEPEICGIAGMHEYNNPYFVEFQRILPVLRKLIKGKDNVRKFGEKIGVSTGTMYSYFRGSVPNIAVCKMITEEGTKIIQDEQKKLENIIENI